ncbi:MAG: TauD/TfdA family dioxygenase [Gammaproteobacteria bacterium]|nr:TauD/TfdA family dioxygenase [Gammaproteobacteria bacterium]
MLPVFAPFNIDSDKDYLIWREQKLAGYPEKLEDLVVEINNPKRLSSAEHLAMHELCAKTNMVIYAGQLTGADKEIPIIMGEQFGLLRLNNNWLADEDAVTSLTVNNEGDHAQYIPYTNRPIKWHTDGYYNSANQQIWGLLLHCVQSAQEGGENQLLDHEIAYIYLRDENPDYIRVFMEADVMTIPERMDANGGVARTAEAGPVFSIHPETGNLHMRYTARSRSIVWKDTPLVKQAVSYLVELLGSDLPYIFKGILQPGMGLVSNNVLHDRSGFNDKDASQRLLYRARYFDRIFGTGVRELYRR